MLFRKLLAGCFVAGSFLSTAYAQAELSADQKELDGKLLGSWIYMAEDKSSFPTPKEMMDKVPNCWKPVQVSKLSFGESASRALPKPANLFGDVIFFRENNGLHRFDTKTGNIILLSEPVTKTVDGRKLWGMISQTGDEFGLHFADTFARGGKAQFMLENDNVYLRCDFKDKPATQSGDGG